MTRTAAPAKVARSIDTSVSPVVMYAVGCSAAPGQQAVVLAHVTTPAQAFEAAELLVREQLAASTGCGDAEAFGDALHDLRREGPQGYGWWTEIAGWEIWYGPVTAAMPETLNLGDMALLATLAGSPLGLAAAC
jgi:hypothetical protein